MALLVAGCAKFPVGGETQNTRLIFRMKVAGRIKNGPSEPSNYVYIVAINPSVDLNPTVQGPVPVIAQPWGNGFVAGNATHFVRYGFEQPAPYTVYKFATPDLLTYGVTGNVLNPVIPDSEGQWIQFELDMSQITPTGVEPQDLQSIQVNFLTMDKIPTEGFTGEKLWDALGGGRDPGSINDWVRIPLNTSRIYDNEFFSFIEEANDGITDPDLDIIDWSVEVRRP